MKYFLFDHAGSLNRGCEAIIRGTMNIISRADKSAAFKLASYRPETDSAIGIETCYMESRELTKFESFISALNVKIAHSEKYALRKMYSPVIEQAKDCDVCLSIGGDTYCYGDNAATREITAELHRQGKKTVLWGASVGEEDLSPEKIEGFKILMPCSQENRLHMNCSKNMLSLKDCLCSMTLLSVWKGRIYRSPTDLNRTTQWALI